MKNMDAPAKLFTGLPEVFCDLVDFALRDTGFKVVRGSLKERNAESIAQLRGVQTWFKKVSNDVVAELKVTDGDVVGGIGEPDQHKCRHGWAKSHVNCHPMGQLATGDEKRSSQAEGAEDTSGDAGRRAAG